MVRAQLYQVVHCVVEMPAYKRELRQQVVFAFIDQHPDAPVCIQGAPHGDGAQRVGGRIGRSAQALFGAAGASIGLGNASPAFHGDALRCTSRQQSTVCKGLQ